ncbi:MAG: arylsulfatase, partial [Mariniphaga sp.]|nr:arylsulfatase [Mariniphaga sp.]
ILADDLGYGDLSCYGQQNFQTPNIDKLAQNGMMFTQHYSGATVCAPSRSALMTGLHTGHTPVRGNKEVQPEGQWPLPDKNVTVAELLKENGYVTGAFGKWGLGFPGSEGDPNNQGFDVFYGYNCQRIGHHYYPYHMWDNQEKVLLEENEGYATGIYGPDIIHKNAIKFLEENKDITFFMYYPSVIPHAELFAPEKYMGKYREKFTTEKDYQGTDDGPDYRNGPYGSQPESHAAFVAMINVLDDQVGEIMATLDELGIAENTLVIFTSDNGPHMEGGADPDYFDSNGPLKGYKRDLYEGGIRVPMIAVWPEKIKSESKSDHISAFWDFLPTVCDVVGIDSPKGIDGISYLPGLIGEEQKKHDYLYWEFHERGGRIAIRQGNWKLIRYNINQIPMGEFELYNLLEDIGEENNVASQYPKKVTELKELLKNARTDSEVFQFNSGTYLAE